MTSRLFVYGTLMRASMVPMAQALRSRADFDGAARYHGRLYRVTSYPAVVSSSEPGEWVHGEVFTLRDPGFLLALDAYEGCGPDDAAPTQYRRITQTVLLDGGASIEAWVYIWNLPVENLERIVSGRFAG